MKTLVIAEKTKAAKALMNGLGYSKFNFVSVGPKCKPPNPQVGYFECDDVIITYARGHLLRLQTIEEYEGAPEKPWLTDILPYVPKEFKLLPADAWQARQLKVIKDLIERPDVDKVVHFGDPDNEGELLIREILLYCNNRKPVKRLWCNTMNPPAIADAYFQLDDINAHTDMYYQALARQQTDWLLGINLSRFMIVKTGQNMPVGRVLVPIVKYVYDRDMEIKNFSETVSFGVVANVSKDKWKTRITNSDPELTFSETDIAYAEDTVKNLNSKDKVVESVSVSKKKIRPKKLFNLSGFQSEMNKTYGCSLKEAGDIAQALYESGFCTYPRTSVEYLSSKEEKAMQKVVATLHSMGLPVQFHNDKSVFDDSKCVDGHTALTLTSNIPTAKDFAGMPKRAKEGYEIIFNRTVSNFMEQPIIEETVVTFLCDNIRFKTNGHKVLKEGFLKFETRPLKNELPIFTEGESVDILFETYEKKTSPPPHITPVSLLAYLANPFADKLKKMKKNDDSEYYKLLKEGASLGTEATVQNIVENAISYGYIKKSGKSFLITEKGVALIELLNQFSINLYRERNVELSKAINAVGKRAISINDNKENIRYELNKIWNANEQTQVVINIPDKTNVGTCPHCGAPVYERDKSYKCSNKAGNCDFFIYKEDKFFASYGKKITPSMAKKLLSKEHSVTLNKLKSKTGKEYSITITADYSGEYVKYTTSFPPKKISKKG